jgi:hypothetical protein
MYRRIVKNKTLLALYASILIVVAVPAPAKDRSLVLGREDDWRDVSAVENLNLVSGRWGNLDYTLKEAEYQPSGLTDLLLHFNNLPSQDVMGRYQVLHEDILLADQVAALGSASAAFNSGKTGTHMLPEPGSLFARGSWIGDFSIEFWLSPALLGQGEQIFSWRGARWNGEEVVPQEVRCTVEQRKLDWTFYNFFTDPEGTQNVLHFRGITALVPRDWHHHLLRYDSRVGLLEYLVDGVPEAILYTTDSQGERGTILLPLAGDASPGSLIIGGDYTGFIDELRISEAFVEMPSLTRYDGHTGNFSSRTFDLGYTGTRLKRIDATYRTPGDSEVYFYFRMTDRADADTSSVAWAQFRPGQSLEDSRGRFLQVMVELFPDGTLEQSPEVSELRIVYEQDLPPAPPTGLYGVAGNGKVRLYWNTVNEQDVKGYLVYYGPAPGVYRSGDSELGPSPIDAGNVSEIVLTGLENGKLYYFSVVAYDATDPPHKSLFSREIGVRPSALLP